MKKLILSIVCSSFFVLNGGRTLPIKHSPKLRLYRTLNNAFYATGNAKDKIEKPKIKKSKQCASVYIGARDQIYDDIQNISEYFKIAQQEINTTPQLRLFLKKDVHHLKNFTNAIIERGKKFSIPKSDLRRKFQIIKEDTIDIMFKLAIHYHDIRL